MGCEAYMKNVWLMYIYSSFFKRVTIPIITLYYLLHSMSYTQIGIITSVAFATSLVTEIAGGMFADKNGKKLSLILAAIFAIITAILLLQAAFWWFIAAAVTWGLASSFVSGTQSSLLYDTLKINGRQDEYRKYAGRRTLWSYLPNAVFLLFIPALYQLNTQLPFIIFACFATVALIVSFFIKDIPREDTPQKVHARIDVKSNLRSIILFGALALAVQWLVADYFQPLQVAAGIPVVLFGFVYAGMRALTGWSATLTHRFKAKTIHWTLTTGTVLGVLLIGIRSAFVLLLGLVILKFVHGFNRVHVEEMISSHSNPEKLTTTLSTYHFSKNIIVMIIAPILGYIADSTSIHTMLLLFTPVLAVALIWSAQQVQVNLL